MPQAMQDLTRKLLLALLLGALPAGGAWAQHDRKPARKSARTVHPKKATACPEFGPGFFRIAGSDTCIRIGGSISVETGVNVQH